MSGDYGLFGVVVASLKKGTVKDRAKYLEAVEAVLDETEPGSEERSTKLKAIQIEDSA